MSGWEFFEDLNIILFLLVGLGAAYLTLLFCFIRTLAYMGIPPFKEWFGGQGSNNP